MTSLRERLLRGFELTIIGTLLALLSVMVLLGTISLVVLLVQNAGTRMREVSDTGMLQQVMQRGFGGVLVVLLGLELIETRVRCSGWRR